MGYFRDLIWGKGTTAREARLRALAREAEGAAAPESVVRYLEFGRGERAIEVLKDAPGFGVHSELIRKIETALAG